MKFAHFYMQLEMSLTELLLDGVPKVRILLEMQKKAFLTCKISYINYLWMYKPKRSEMTVSRKWSTGSDDGRPERRDTLSQKEKEILKKMAEALPNMPEIKKGELLGYAKAMVDLKKQKKEEEEVGDEE